MKLDEYFSELEIINEENVKKACDIFGKEEVMSFLDNINNNGLVNRDLVQKVDNYLRCIKLSHELKTIV